MATYLKKRVNDSPGDDPETRIYVEGMLKDIRSRGEEAVRELAVRHDRWEGSFMLQPEEVERLCAQVPDSVKQDIQFAHGNTFAGNPLACAAGIAVIEEIETRSAVELLAIGIGHDVTRYYSRAVTITDVDGKQTLDAVGGLWNVNLGFSCKPVKEAIAGVSVPFSAARMVAEYLERLYIPANGGGNGGGGRARRRR